MTNLTFKKTIPMVINRFNVYNSGDRLIGITGEMELPTVTMLVSSEEGAGTGGNMDIPVIGLTENMDLKLNFSAISQEMMEAASIGTGGELTLRGAVQTMDRATSKIGFSSLTIYVRGLTKEIAPGKVKAGEKMESSLTLSLTYYKIELDGETILEIDKLNDVFVVNGVDLLKEVRDMC